MNNIELNEKKTILNNTKILSGKRFKATTKKGINENNIKTSKRTKNKCEF